MVKVVSNSDLGWAAGFIEADGTMSELHTNSAYIGADQKSSWPLERLVSLFGGKVYSYSKKEGVYHRWYLYGDKAVVVIKLLYNHFSPRRQESAKRAIKRNDLKKPRSWHNITKTHCKHGHPYSGDNLIIKKSGGRGCRECQRAASRRYYYKSQK